MKKHNCPISAQLVIPASFAECVTYEKQILWLKKEIDNLSGGGDPAIIDELRNQIAMVESEVEALQEQLDAYAIEALEQSVAQLEANVQLVINSLNEKQDKLTFDTEPTAGSTNPVTSWGIQQAIYDEGMRLEQLINDKVDESTFNDAIDNITDNYATNTDVQNATSGLVTKEEISDMETKTNAAATYATKTEIEGLVTTEELNNATSTLATKEELAGKQNELTFDATPTAGSENPVTSGGIYEALQNVSPEGYLEETVLPESENAVKSSGIYQFVTDTTSNLATKEEISDMETKTSAAATYATKEEISDMETKTNAAATYATKTELAGKQDVLTLEDEVYCDSENPVKSFAICNYVDDAVANLATKSEIEGLVTTEELSNATSTLATKEELSGKQDSLTFDTTPTAGSNNPVTSEGLAAWPTSSVATNNTKPITSQGVKAYIDGITQDSYVQNPEGYDIYSAGYVNEAMAGKQNTLTFDSTPTEGSINPVTSDGIKKAIDAAGPSVTVDATVSQSSENPVSSNGIYNFVLDQMGDLVTTEQLATKQDKLTFDQTPTAGSSNPVTSGGIKSYVDSQTADMATKTDLANYATTAALQSATADMETKTNAAATYATKTALAGKQDELTFDQTPTEGSSNPVTSGGVYEALQNVSPEITLESEVYSDSENAVKSYAIFNFVTDEIDDAVQNLATKTEISDMETKTNAAATYATKTEIEGFVTEEELSSAVSGKQDTLTFDTTPKSGSSNPVTSGGIYNAIQSASGLPEQTIFSFSTTINVSGETEVNLSSYYTTDVHWVVGWVQIYATRTYYKVPFMIPWNTTFSANELILPYVVDETAWATANLSTSGKKLTVGIWGVSATSASVTIVGLRY